MKAEWTNKDSLSIESTGQKAVLVIDMPSCCTACPFFEFVNGDDYEDCRTICIVKSGVNEYGAEVRPKWCPLKPMPKRKIVLEHRVGGYTVNGIEMTQAHGYNECLDELVGETE